MGQQYYRGKSNDVINFLTLERNYYIPAIRKIHIFGRHPYYAGKKRI